MERIKLIGKAFVAIALFPILLIGGFFAVSFVAPLCFGGISHPLFGMIAVLLMIPWGLLFFCFFFIGFSLPTTVTVIPTYQGYYVNQSGRNGSAGIIISILRLIFTAPIALLMWLVASVALFFSKKVQEWIALRYESFAETFKQSYKAAIAVFVLAPLIVLGLDALEDKMYSPDHIKIECQELVHGGRDKYHDFDYFYFTYTVHPNGKDLMGITGKWEFINKKTGKSILLNEKNLLTYDWYARNKDNSIPHPFEFSIHTYNQEDYEFLNGDPDNIKIVYHLTEIVFDSNIPILGDFLFPKVSTEYKDGYTITVKE